MHKRSDDLNYSMSDVLILDSTYVIDNFDRCWTNWFLSHRSTSKFSRHLIFQTTDPFLDNLAVGRFVNLILEDIHGCLVNHQCPAVLNASPYPSQATQPYADSTVFARNLLATIESRLPRFEHCQCIDDYSQLHFRDIVEFVVKKSDGVGLTWFCDMGKRIGRLLLIECPW
jgi:hypothetical protein